MRDTVPFTKKHHTSPWRLILSLNFWRLSKSWPITVIEDGEARNPSSAEYMQWQVWNSWWGYRPYFAWETEPGFFCFEFFWWRWTNGTLQRRVFGVVPDQYSLVTKLLCYRGD